LQTAQIYHQEEGVELFVPWGPFYTNEEGIAKLHPKAVEIFITKEGYKSAVVEKLTSKVTEVFLYCESEKYESGLTNFKKCKE